MSWKWDHFRTVSGTSAETRSPLLVVELALEVQLVSFRAARMAR